MVNSADPAELAARIMLAVEQRMLALTTEMSAPGVTSAGQQAAAARHHLASGGRRVRARLAVHAGIALGLADADIIAIASAVELLHNASLVHDDLQDQDPDRRGATAVWVAFGNDVAICTGDLLLSAAYRSVADLHSLSHLPAVLRLMHAAINAVIGGQCDDLAARAMPVHDLATYQTIAKAKTGPLLGLPVALALLLAGHEAQLTDVQTAAECFGLAYQIKDDIADVDDDRAHSGRAAKLNVVAVLAQSMSATESVLQAKQLCLANVDRAINIAMALPNGSGMMLAGLATAMVKAAA